MVISIKDPDKFMDVMGRGLNRFALDMGPAEDGNIHFREIEARPLPLTFTHKIYEAHVAEMRKAQAENPNGPLPFGPSVAAQLTMMASGKSMPKPQTPPRSPKKKR